MQGTLPFKSNQLLRGEPIEYHLDLESYFWLAYLITCNCAGPFNMRRDWNREIEMAWSGQPVTPTLINNLAKIKTQGDCNKVATVPTDHALDSKECSANHDELAIRVDYHISWVRPGVHALTPGNIMNQRENMSDFANLMTPYFARHQAVRDGMLELYTLFFGSMEECQDGFVRRRAPAQPVTHDKMLSIFRRIRDGIHPTEDTYPAEEVRLNARDRYNHSLKSGNHIPLMEDEEGLKKLSSKRASDSEGLLTRASKRGRTVG
jgi:hypothetical protein